MQLKVNAGRFKVPINLESISENRLKVSFRYNKALISEIKSMRGAKWDPLKKQWTIDDCARNWFTFNYMQGEPMYARYDKPLIVYDNAKEFKRPVFKHQIEMVSQGMTRRQCIFACEMGTGKTLAAIEIMERSGFEDWWWIGPRSALAAVELEFLKWGCTVNPRRLTYENLKRVLANWQDGTPSPRGIIFDESSKIKNHTAQRSEAAAFLVETMRKEHKNPYIILMSGSPAPKNPVDWWHQLEMACPGFLKEGHPTKLRRRLALVQNMESIIGGVFPKLITWWDDKNKCKHCGQLADANEHKAEGIVFAESDSYHQFEESINEVHVLYQRMQGLVLIKMKKDCLDLPEKQYREIQLQPSASTLRAAKLIAAKSERALTALMLLRELSDGFQYVETAEGRIVKEVRTPKEDMVKELLEDHEDAGRIVLYAGFSASVDRITKICRKAKWDVLQVDGRGWKRFGDISCTNDSSLEAFQNRKTKFPKMAFVGQPSAGGMGLTLTASPSIVFWSNDFNGESRIQAEDRIHRIGTKGANIIDLLHLPTDKLILDNLKGKKKLQNVSLGVVNEVLKEKTDERRF